MKKLLSLIALFSASCLCGGYCADEYTDLSRPLFKIRDGVDVVDYQTMGILFSAIKALNTAKTQKTEFQKESNINQRYLQSRGPHDPPLTCTPLCWAVYLSNVANEGYRIKKSPFKQKPFKKIISLLLEKNANPNCDFPIFETIKTANLPIFTLLAQHQDFDPTIRYARTNRTALEEIEVRLKRGDTNKTILQKMKKILEHKKSNSK